MMSTEYWLLLACIFGGLLVLIKLAHGALWLYDRYQHRRVKRSRAQLQDALESAIRLH